MKQTLYILIALCGVALFGGCTGEEHSPLPEEQPERARLRLSGSLQAQSFTTRSPIVPDPGGMIHPIAGAGEQGTKSLPPYQLEIGIITTELFSLTGIKDWDNETTYLDRGFFGGQYPGDKPENYEGEADEPEDPENELGKYASTVWTGNIEYTNRMGTAIQQVFYDEMVGGVTYFLVAFYPYHAVYDIAKVEEEENETMIWDDEGASVVFQVDGSQDIMASTMGFANIEAPFDTSLYFSHKLTALRCHFVAESELAEMRYGNILSVELMNQPEFIGLNIGKQAEAEEWDDELFDAAEDTQTDYSAVRSSNDALPLPYPTEEDTPATPIEFGYMLAMPAQSYTFRIITEVRDEDNPLYATYTFPTDDLPLAGTIYKLTFTMVETADIVLEVAAAEEWTFDQTFD
ncbi:hypothetical protein [Parabacteroides sp. PF5-6]|uniref:hypothetical protein n=1 Tax=Parabacteroides sp. PF5-6 TaxID=1742403 RepID=UPI00240710BE|nr:hypothetical protein [Parabacteroides sp. PF5-6]MDF9829918.1 hypothetical protein [Parabacteroides sp. PF5-6]